MKQKLLLSGLCLLLLCCKAQQERSRGPVPQGSYTPYTAAMGKGKGIIFRVQLDRTSQDAFTIDSFYVGNKPLPFLLHTSGTTVLIEANYLVSEPEPAEGGEGAPARTGRRSPDPLVDEHAFYPSWICIIHNGKISRIAVTQYTEKRQGNE